MSIQKTIYQRLKSIPYYNKIKQYNKLLSTLGIALIVIIIVGVGYIYLYQKPLEDKANKAITTIEYIFSSDTSAIAMRILLDGSAGNFKGALQIAKEYGGTPAGELACFYAGAALLRLGQMDSSIKYLQKCTIKEKNLSAKVSSLLGDAYANKGNYAKAASLYLSAAETNNTNLVTTPEYYLRAGILFEMSNNIQNAKKAYQSVIDLFPEFTETPYSGITFVSEAKKRLARLN